MPDVDLREIEVFLTLAGELRFGRTDERLGLTQSRVSQVIRTLSRDDRVLVVAADHPLARRQSVSVEDLADCVVPDPPTVPRETSAALIPSITPSGRPIARRTGRTLSDVVTLVALGEIVHPTVTSFGEYHHHHGITAVPLTGLPPSETALAWLTNHLTAKVTAFADAATTVLEAHGGP